VEYGELEHKVLYVNGSNVRIKVGSTIGHRVTWTDLKENELF
jgi:hypothetical protein